MSKRHLKFKGKPGRKQGKKQIPQPVTLEQAEKAYQKAKERELHMQQI